MAIGCGGGGFQAFEGAHGQQAFEAGGDTGIIALVVQKTIDVNPRLRIMTGRPGQQLFFTKVKIGYGKGDKASFSRREAIRSHLLPRQSCFR